MAKNLIVVESPAKARTLTKYLGKSFKALASYGHVRDLLPKSGAVDTERDFEMHYSVIEKNEKHVDAIAKAMKSADALYLATDPDREGEAISWHLYELLKERDALDGKPVHRVVFYEITKNAIQEAVEHPRELSTKLIDAQQARRALDYLVGFNLSPLLWKKVRRGLSAGRVQSPALRLICEREEEIDAFVSREYWTIDAELEQDKTKFTAKLTHFAGEKLEQFSIANEQRATEVVSTIQSQCGGEMQVIEVERKERRRNPAPPFTTSTLQQEASRKLGFGAQRTMRIAQQLYEGVDIDGDSIGLITYMRTDSVNLANDAIQEIRKYVIEQYGSDNVPEKPQVYKNKSKNAQEAHEAVRPTSLIRAPAEIKSALSADQFKLYDLIWKRAVASQMIHATMDTVAVDFDAGTGTIFRSTGSTIKHAGFMRVYLEGLDEKEEKDADKTDDKERRLPALEKGDRVPVHEIRKDQHFTEPPPRYTEASLVKTLEAYGIGRPSTYASIISTLVNREYVELEQRRFRPTDVGKVVSKFLTNHFTRYVDYDFTARLEDELDAVSRGEKEWRPVIHDFWGEFIKLVEEKETSVSREEAMQARELGTDPKSGRPVSVRMGRYGPFVQIGTKDDEEKPRFAGLHPGQKMDEIDLEQALTLFKLPRHLGETPEGEKVSANVGRFGPYIRYDDKYVSLRDGDPYTVTLEQALELVTEKKKLDASRVIQVFEEGGVQVLRGRYGPYVTNGAKNARVPKDMDPEKLSLTECEELIANAPEKGTRGKQATKKEVTAKAETEKKVTKKKGKKTKRKKKTSKKTAKKKTDNASKNNIATADD